MSFDNFENEDVEQMLRKRQLTFKNIEELLEMMARTRDERRQWILAKMPGATTIIKRYPCLLDINATVRAKL